MAKHKNHNFRDYHSFGNYFGCITAILSIHLKWYAYDVENTVGNARWWGPEPPAEYQGKKASASRESQPALSYEHRKFYKGFRGKARSRKPGLCEEALRRFTMNPGREEGVGMGRTNANADLSIFFSNRQKSAELANSKGRALGKVLSVLHQHCNLVPTGKELKENLGKIKHKQRDKHCGFSNFCVNLTFSRLLFNIIFKSDLKWPLKKLKWRSLKITFENSLCWIAYETSRL